METELQGEAGDLVPVGSPSDEVDDVVNRALEGALGPVEDLVNAEKEEIYKAVDLGPKGNCAFCDPVFDATEDFFRPPGSSFAAEGGSGASAPSVALPGRARVASSNLPQATFTTTDAGPHPASNPAPVEPATNPFAVAIQTQPSPQPTLPMQGLLLGAAALGAAAAFLLVDLRWLLLRVWGAGLFSRLSADDVTTHPRRRSILDLVNQQPGLRISTLRATLSMPNGALFHHLLILEARGLVKLQRKGKASWVLPAKSGKVTCLASNEARGKILELLRSLNPTTSKEIRAATGLSKRVVGYHMKLLVESHVTRVDKRGRESLYSLEPQLMTPSGKTGLILA